MPRSDRGIEPAVAGAMATDVVTLIHRDHDELDRILLAMVDPAATPSECVALLDSLRISFTAHAGAQATMLRRMLGDAEMPQAIRMIMSITFDEHWQQATALTTLAATRPGSSAWLTSALELRVLVLDHASREDDLRASLADHVPAERGQALASGYAIERLRRIGSVASRTRRERVRPWLFS